MFLPAVFLLPVFFVPTVAQTIQREVVSIHREQTFQLEGGASATLTGRSRQLLKVTLPPGTVSWYYAVTTQAKPTSSMNLIGLASQLSRIVDPTGITSVALNALNTPQGQQSCDVYVITSAQSKKYFEEKADQGLFKRKQFSYDTLTSRIGFKGGVVQDQRWKKGSFYLGLRNPNAFESLQLTVEVVAIVEKAIPAKAVDTLQLQLQERLADKLLASGDSLLAMEAYSKLLIEQPGRTSLRVKRFGLQLNREPVAKLQQEFIELLSLRSKKQLDSTAYRQLQEAVNLWQPDSNGIRLKGVFQELMKEIP